MITAVAPMPSASTLAISATVRVEKATSEFLNGPDWTLNIDICDSINSNRVLAKDVVKAVKKRLQNKNPRIQLLALTLLETMVKNCGDYVHFQIAERNVLHEMVKIVKKRTDFHVRNKVLTLIGCWYEAFGGVGGKYSQYYTAYEELRCSGVQFPRHLQDAALIYSPPITPKQPLPGYGMPSSSLTRLDEAMAAEDNLSLSSMNSIRNVLDLMSDMLQAVDPSDRSAVKGEVIVDLVEQCRVNQRKMMQLLGATRDEELLRQGLELNDSLQTVLAKHDAIASGTPLPAEVTKTPHDCSKKHDSGHGPDGPSEVITGSPTSNGPPSAPVSAHTSVVDKECEEEDDFAQLAQRHSIKTGTSDSSSPKKSDSAPPEASSLPAISNALVPVDQPPPVRSIDQDLIDLLSITLSSPATSTEQTSQTPIPTPGHVSSTGPSTTFSWPDNNGLAFNNYIAPWAQPQPTNPRPQPFYTSQPQQYPPPLLQARPEMHPHPQFPQYTTTTQYPPPPWAATPSYFSNQNPASRPSYTYLTPRPTSGSVNDGPKPFVPSYRLFEDLDVFGNAGRGLKSKSNASPSMLGSSNCYMIGGRK